MEKNTNKNGKQLNKLEIELQKGIENLLFTKGVKFSVFLPVLRDDLPEDKSSNEYKNKHKSEYLKLLRASFSAEEVQKMLSVLDYDLVLTLKGKVIKPKKYGLDDIKVKYTDFMAVCELLGITIEWVAR